MDQTAHLWSVIADAVARHPVIPYDDRCRADVLLPGVSAQDLPAHLEPS